MFNVILRRHGRVISNYKRYEVMRRTNYRAASKFTFTFRNTEEKLENWEKQDWIKQMRLNNVNQRNYSSLPKPVEEKDPEILFNRENAFAYTILKSKGTYANNIVKNLPLLDEEITQTEVNNYLYKSWKSLPIPEIIEAFIKISNYALKNGESIIDKKYEKFLKYLIANCDRFTDSELSDVLRSIILWPHLHTRHDANFKSLYEALDKECLSRAPKWSINELLFFCDHWYRLKLYKYSEYGTHVLKKMTLRTNRMTPSHLVQYMFYVNSSRKGPGVMYNLEYKMESCVDELDLNELAILAMGFFKSRTPIRNNKLLVKIIHRVINEVDTIHEMSLAAFMKIIRYSFTIQSECGIVWELLVATIPRVPKLALPALVHILATSVRMRLFHPELITLIAERFNNEMKDARLKDIERLILGLTCFNFNPNLQPNIFESIVQEISKADRREEFVKFPRVLATLLQYLSVVNLYPKDLIALTLDDAHLKSVYGPSAYNITHTILVVDLNVDVDVPDYTGPRLSNTQRAIIAKEYLNKLPEQYSKYASARQNFLYEILDVCKEIFGPTENTHPDWVLPQYKEPDIIICLDKNNSPLPVKSILSEMPLGDVKRRPNIYPEGSRWLAVVIGSQNCYIRNSDSFLGKDSVKIRQLERIGYKPVVIPWFEWYKTEQDRQKLLKQMLFE